MLKERIINRIQEGFWNSSLRIEHISLGSYISLPIPTKRFGVPGFIIFTAPAPPISEKEVVYGEPQFFVVVDAKSGKDLLFASTAALPLGTPVAGDLEEDPTLTVDEAMAATANLVTALEEATAFLTGDPVAPGLSLRLNSAMRVAVPAPMRSWYHAAAPDFFEWLEAGR